MYIKAFFMQIIFSCIFKKKQSDYHLHQCPFTWASVFLPTACGGKNSGFTISSIITNP